jgi:tetratricopeptide (TPR) repeat protein
MELCTTACSWYPLGRMRARHFLFPMFAAGVAAATLLSSASAGGPTKPVASSSSRADAAAEPKYDSNNRTHISQFMEMVALGNAKYISRDFPAAIETYRKAIALQPTQPLGHYLLGEAQLASGNATEAEASFLAADNVADRDPRVKVKVLFCLADLKERQKKWDDAKTAWQRYNDYAQAHGDAGAMPASATMRIQAIDEALKQDKAYEAVRARIAADKADAGTK